MNLTICLVTRGRSYFLDDCLRGLENCLQSGLANILVFNNGAPPEISLKLADWCLKNGVECITYKENDSRPTRVWREIRQRNLGWVVFPGDDDIFMVESLARFHVEVAANKTLSAVAFNIETIGSDGHKLNKVRKPVFNSDLSKPISIAKSFHEPQFLWPSLFFRADLITQSVPSSRYYFDWWIGQILILEGEICLVDECSLKYREHPLQESNLANNRRKYFEATQWLINLIDSEIFSDWASNLTKEEIIEFWNHLLLHQPIYSSEYFSGQILQKVLSSLVALRAELNLFPELLGSYAATKGVWLRTGELNNLTSAELSSGEPYPSNISIRPTKESCPIMLEATQKFASAFKPSYVYVVSCNHSSGVKSDYSFDCQFFVGLEADQVADQIVLALVQKAEDNGDFQFITSGIEKAVIIWLRKLKKYVPGWFLSSMRVFVIKRGHGN